MGKLNCVNEIVIVFDSYMSPSLKDMERERRKREDKTEKFNICGPEQKHPGNFHQLLLNDSFKQAFIEFFQQTLKTQPQQFKNILKDKTIYSTTGRECVKINVTNDEIQISIINNLNNNHEEADTKIIHFLASQESTKSVVVKAQDTDVLVLLIGNFRCFFSGMKIWMETGKISNNTLR